MLPEEHTLNEFLTLGKLKELALGISLTDIMEYIGSPDGFRTLEEFQKDLLGLKLHAGATNHIGIGYGVLDLAIEKTTDRLSMIHINLENGMSKNLPAPLNDGWLSLVDGMSRQSFREYISTHHIKCLQELHRFEEALWLRIPSSCVAVTFTLENGRDEVYHMTKSIWGDNCSTEGLAEW